MAAASSSTACRGKVRYECRADANKARGLVRDYSMNVYHCQICGGYHIGRPAGSGIKHPYRRERFVLIVGDDQWL